MPGLGEQRATVCMGCSSWKLWGCIAFLLNHVCMVTLIFTHVLRPAHCFAALHLGGEEENLPGDTGALAARSVLRC